MKQTIIVTVVAVLGIAGGWFVGNTMHKKTYAKALESEAQLKSVEAKLAKSDKRIAELEHQLADAAKRAKRAQEEAVKAKSDALAAAATAKKDGEEKSEAIVVKDGDIASALKKRLPAEQFSQVTNAFSQFRAKLAKRAKNRQDYLASIDTSNMSAKQKANHQRYLELFAKREAAAAKMKGGIPNQASIQELVMIGMEMNQVAKDEREMLMGQVASELGITGDDATVFTDAIKNIYDCTNAGPLSGINDMVESMGSMGGLGGGDDESGVKVQTHVIGL